MVFVSLCISYAYVRNVRNINVVKVFISTQLVAASNPLKLCSKEAERREKDSLSAGEADVTLTQELVTE